MENSSIVSTTTGGPNQLPILVISQHEYPTHDPNLAHLVAPISRQNLPDIRLQITYCNSSTIQTDTLEDQEQHHPTTEFGFPNSQNQTEMTTLSIGNSNHDSSNVNEMGGTVAVSIGDEDQSIDLTLTELNGFMNPKDVAFLLRLYPLFLGLVVGKFIWEKHTPFPITNPFMVISVVVYAMAFLNLLILCCIYDGLKSMPGQHLSPGHYKISKYVYYILCFLAPFLLLPVLFIPRD